jgi:phospholipase/carboxylesterase
VSDDANAESDAPFLEAAGHLAPALLGMLVVFDRIQRQLHPPRLPDLREIAAPVRDRLASALERAAALTHSAELDGVADALLKAARHAARAADLFLGGDEGAEGPEAGVATLMTAFREHCRAQAAVFPLCAIAPAFDRYFIEPGADARLRELSAAPTAPGRAGIFNASNDPDVRGGFSFFVPADYDESRAWPLVVALHGGFGHGGDFLWSWLREARTRGWLLLAPTSKGTTWSMIGSDHDAPALDSMLDYIEDRWNVDGQCRLLTGLSDGGTYALLRGLAEGSRFSALAPLAAALHPANLANGNLERASGVRIRWVHGALDWMFPLAWAREGAGALRAAGAEVELVEIADLSHAYPREQNGSILEWASEPAPAA